MYSVIRWTVDSKGNTLFKQCETVSDYSIISAYMRMYDSNNEKCYRIRISCAGRTIYQK